MLIAKIHIYISYFLAFLGFLAGIVEIYEKNLMQNEPFFILILIPIISSYVWWALYWGQVWFWTAGKDWVVATFGFLGCLPTLTLILFCCPFLGTFYGILGGAIYQYAKYRMLIE